MHEPEEIWEDERDNPREPTNHEIIERGMNAAASVLLDSLFNTISDARRMAACDALQRALHLHMGSPAVAPAPAAAEVSEIQNRGRSTLPADDTEAGPSVASTPTAPAVDTTRTPAAAEVEATLGDLLLVRGRALEAARITDVERIDPVIDLLRRLSPSPETEG
jgi:hypothetical protein